VDPRNHQKALTLSPEDDRVPEPFQLNDAAGIDGRAHSLHSSSSSSNNKRVWTSLLLLVGKHNQQQLNAWLHGCWVNARSHNDHTIRVSSNPRL
jgi:hypothetical protein